MRSQDALEGLLDLCDQIRLLHERALRSWPGEDSPPAADETRHRVRGLRRDYLEALPSLRERPRALDLSDPELLLLALLFHRRLTGLPAALTGGDAVAILGQAGFERTRILEFLGPRAPLRRQGWLRAETQGGGFDPLDTRLTPSAEALALFWPGGKAGAERPPAPAAETRPYADEAEYLWELHRWRNLCIRRAEALFEPDGMNGLSPAAEHSALVEQTRAAHLQVRARLAATPGGPRFQIEQFRRSHGLGADEMLVTLHLLFAEVLEGDAWISGVECLRILASHRNEVFTKREVVGPRGRLRRRGILLVPEDQLPPGKGALCEMSLADWASEALLAGVGDGVRLAREEIERFLEGGEEPSS